MGLIPGGASKEGIKKSWEESEVALKVKKVCRNVTFFRVGCQLI